MLLRRVTKHVKEQDWFAVFLDFVIVVIGILIAFQITNYSQSLTQQDELRRAEDALQYDFRQNYFNAKERISLRDCRIEQLRNLADPLLEPGENWAGATLIDLPGTAPVGASESSESTHAIAPVLRSPSRRWGSRVWVAELARGTFAPMEANRRDMLDGLFDQTEHAERLQRQIQALQSRLKILSQPMVLKQQDRLRYLDVITEIDETSFFLEIISAQILDALESIDITADKATRENFLSFWEGYNESRLAQYGICVNSFELPFLDPPAR
ncbi:MAG: hypothetical protein ABJ056_10175 [Halioglobus sp.]